MQINPLTGCGEPSAAKMYFIIYHCTTRLLCTVRRGRECIPGIGRRRITHMDVCCTGRSSPAHDVNISSQLNHHRKSKLKRDVGFVLPVLTPYEITGQNNTQE